MRTIKLYIRNATYQTLRLEPYNPNTDAKMQFSVLCKGMSPMSLSGLTLVFEGGLDDCSKVRLQYPSIPDFEEDRLAPISFVWEKPIENIDQNFDSLKRQEIEQQKTAKLELEQIALMVTETLPNGNVEIKQVTNSKNEPVNNIIVAKTAKRAV